MDRARQPIGVFDSGVGGVSVLRELITLMPNENYIFYGDSKNAPYGAKSVETVLELACADAEHLIKQGVKALVVACNTATSAAITVLRQRYKNIPIIGIEPALKPAVEKETELVHRKPRILVMATQMTLREEKFHQLMEMYQQHADIYPVPCPGLVEFVERRRFDGNDMERLLEQFYAPYRKKGVDAVVLGCTHYAFLRKTIQKVIGEGIPLFDGGKGTARETKHRLTEEGLLNPGTEKGSIVFQNSLPDTSVLDFCKHLLEIEL